MHISGRTAAVTLPDGSYIVTHLDTSVCIRLDGPAAALWSECSEHEVVDVPHDQQEIAHLLVEQGFLVP